MTPEAALTRIELLHGSPPTAISDCLRSMIVSKPGYDLVVADYAAIEARTEAWLAGEEAILRQFREYDAGTGKEPYCLTAESIYGYPVEKKTHPKERGVGKVGDLQLGYEGGIGAFGTMAKTTGVDLHELYEAVAPTIRPDEAEKAERNFEFYKRRAADPLPELEAIACDVVKQRWRAAHPKTVEFWPALRDAAMAAIRSPGTIHRVGRVAYRKLGSFLFCQLPSGRCLSYAYPKIGKTAAPWDDTEEVPCESEDLARERYGERFIWFDKVGGTVLLKPKPTTPTIFYKGVDSTNGQWRTQYTYGGKLAENVTQAVARDLLAEGMLQVEAAGYPVVMHVHDEAVAEVPEGFGSVGEFETLMAKVPAWAQGCPVKAEGWRGKRYRKD